ncbi:MAG: tetratricopeptide repeat protein [Candidatus Aminicenantes bacterium]|nr:MAG: tetratricopeptide repeat protein [Candidatus Aminicenantes bacterium]
MSTFFRRFFEEIFGRLTGFNLIVAIIALIAIAIYWWLSGKKIVGKARLGQRILRVIWILLIAVVVIGVQAVFVQFPKAFPEWKTGILIAQIEGDDENGIRQDLVNTLETELEKDTILMGIEVETLPLTITETMGHAEARKYGKKYKARLVIWGSRGGDLSNRIIQPRVTVLSEEYLSAGVANQDFKAQVIEEIKLLPFSVERPGILNHFVLAQCYYSQYEFEKAMIEFEKCLELSKEDKILGNSIRFWLAMTYADLGHYLGKTEYLAKAIDVYRNFLYIWTEWDYPIDWAATQHNLGLAYSELPTGDQERNLRRAIAHYENALRIRTEQDFPVNWAATQHDLGIAYSKLPTGDREENLIRAIECYENALRVRTERDFPLDWAMTQYNLGVAYSELQTGNIKENLEKAIQCFRNALKVWTEEKFPYDYETAKQASRAAIDKLLKKVLEK